MWRKEIFETDRDREHFVELLEEMVERYDVVLHAYVLMDNHYHLLIETPEANASRALQWLNLSYAAWFNAKHERSGPVFQARFKSIPVDGEGSWALTCSIYIHLNPVRIRSLGQGKDERAREKAGFMQEGPTAEQVKARLAVLRNHPWSSYHAYAGYAPKPDWLTCERLWWHAGQEKGVDQKADYRRYLEDYLRQGVEEGLFARLTAALAIGGTTFIENLRRKVPKRAGGETNARSWRRLLPFAEVVRAIESVRGERWDDFIGRHGDYGRDLALHIGRLKCGLTLRELGKEAGGMTVPCVAKACERMAKSLKDDRKMQRVSAKILKKLIRNEEVNV
jgi:REP element-mobilizing transposase RayT